LPDPHRAYAATLDRRDALAVADHGAAALEDPIELRRGHTEDHGLCPPLGLATAHSREAWANVLRSVGAVLIDLARERRPSRARPRIALKLGAAGA